MIHDEVSFTGPCRSVSEEKRGSFHVPGIDPPKQDIELNTNSFENLPPHVQRLWNEYTELVERLSKLGAFLRNKEIFDKVNSTEQILLQSQREIMNELEKVLWSRLVLNLRFNNSVMIQ